MKIHCLFLFIRKLLWNFLANKRHYVSIMRSYSVRYSTKLERTSLSGICVVEKKFIASQYRSRAESSQENSLFFLGLVCHQGNCIWCPALLAPDFLNIIPYFIGFTVKCFTWNIKKIKKFYLILHKI